MRVLVAGARQVDAGKTTFTRGLRAAIGAPAFKPRAANDRWYDHDAYRRAIDEGRLYGKDARLLAEDQGPETTIESINPVHRLWRQIPDPAGGMHDVPHRQFVVDRVGDGFVVNARADVPSELAAALPLDDARRVGSIEELNRVVSDVYAAEFEALADRIAGLGTAVVESYGDIASPLPSVDVDVAAVVEPGRVRCYDGERFQEAATAVAQTPREGSIEPVVDDVVARLEPVERARLPALPSAIRSDPVEIARANREAYQAVVAAAR